MAEEEPLKLTAFSSALVKPNSILTIIGKNTNIKAIYKDYGKYFESPGQLKNIMDTLLEGQSLVIDETSPRNQVVDLLYKYTP
jgi:hypothetical protein